MSSYLMYRYIFNKEKSFYKDRSCRIAELDFPRVPVKTASGLLSAIEKIVSRTCKERRAALALSGGMDSAILAKFMPEQSKAYTFRCIVPGKKVTDEFVQAGKWAKMCNLKHEVIDIYWEDIVSASTTLMRQKGAPVHSIEAQIYIAARKARQSGYQTFVFGENADIIYGGMDGLLARDWSYSEFVERYTYIMPYKVLRCPRLIVDPFREFEVDGYIDGHRFINKYFRQEALGTYQNACETAGIEFSGPYAMTYLDGQPDYQRIRSGDTKYLIREAFRMLYPGESIPEKLPMPRPMNEWLKDWAGPQRDEFIPHCTDHMNGDHKWMVWALEKFLNTEDGKREYE